MRHFAVVVVAAVVLAVVGSGCARTLAGGGAGTFVPNHRAVVAAPHTSGDGNADQAIKVVVGRGQDHRHSTPEPV